MAYDPAAFFDHFKLTPFTDSNGTEHIGRNLLNRVAVFSKIRQDQLGLVRYTVKDGERPDHIAYNYYGEDRYSWVIYLVNGILDPIHDWPLSTVEFEDYIKAKYGSLGNAQRRVKFYRVNWPTDLSEITRQQYEALSAAQKHYWNPVFGINNIPLYYHRKELEITAATNRQVRIDVDTTDGLVVGHRYKIVDDLLDDPSFEISYIGDSYIIVQHVEGVISSSGVALYDVDDNNTTKVVAWSLYTDDNVSSGVIQNNLEGVNTYYEKVSMYDWEEEENERKKEIWLLEKNLLPLISENLRGLLENA
jgi:hypothetical protein